MSNWNTGNPSDNRPVLAAVVPPRGADRFHVVARYEAEQDRWRSHPGGLVVWWDPKQNKGQPRPVWQELPALPEGVGDGISTVAVA